MCFNEECEYSYEIQDKRETYYIHYLDLSIVLYSNWVFKNLGEGC
jgi:hypothetical protein